MNVQSATSSSQQDDEVAELNRPSTLWTRATVMGVLLGLALVLLMVTGMFWLGDYYLQQRAETSTEQGPSLSELRAADDSELTTYGWINQTEGQARIPVARAMELLAEQAEATRDTPLSAPTL